MRADTVAAAVAAHYGVSKAQLLDAAAADLPLRMALGEAQVGGQKQLLLWFCLCVVQVCVFCLHWLPASADIVTACASCS